MGEIAEMMLDGTLCQTCGVYLDGEGDGFAVTCNGCQDNKPKKKNKRGPYNPKGPRAKQGEVHDLR